MSETQTDNTNPPAPTSADVERLTKALDAARGDTKKAEAKASEFRKGIAGRLGLSDDSAPDAILARLGEADTEKIVAERLAPVVKERDDARTRLAEVESRAMDSALLAAFEKSGARQDVHPDDFLSLARPVFGVDEKGQVRTKADAPNALPGVDAATWIMAELRAKRPAWWPLSVGGNARGSRGGIVSDGVPGDATCFKPGPTWNLTGQGQYLKAYGADAYAKAARLFGGGR